MSHTSEYKGCVVIQGPINTEILNDIRKGWDGYKLIFSTWQGVDLSNFYTNETVLISEMPEHRGVMNFQLQKLSTIVGMRHAKELGWNRAVKWRSDMIPMGDESFWNLFDSERLNFYMWTDANDGYLTDYFMEGNIDDIINLFDVTTEGPFPEWNITHRARDLGMWNRLNCIGNNLDGKMDVRWVSKGFLLSTNLNNNVFTHNIPENWGL